MVTREYIEERFHVDPEGHWMWDGYVNKRTGYAQGPNGSGDIHRHAYEIWIGPIPPNSDLDHAKGCPKHCINPYTLTPVHRDMNQRLLWRRRTGQMGRKDLRVARLLHKRVGERGMMGA